jgi:hypothetical protein
MAYYLGVQGLDIHTMIQLLIDTQHLYQQRTLHRITVEGWRITLESKAWTSIL